VTAPSPRPAAPDTTGGELRSVRDAVALWLLDTYPDSYDSDARSERRDADTLLDPDGPLRALLAERDTLVAKVQAVEELVEELPHDYLPMSSAQGQAHDIALRIRLALGTPTTGGDR
jgi:hypothetical protein